MEQAKIFLSAERGLLQAEHARTYHSFNSGAFYNEHKAGFCDLYLLNDETLAAGHSISVNVDRKSYVLIIPVVGQVDYADTQCGTIAIQPGQLFIKEIAAGGFIQLSNPYDEALINFLQFRIAVNDSAGNFLETGVLNFDLDHLRDGLLQIIVSDGKLPMALSIGKFAGRQELIYQLKSENNGLYAFVLEGAFELQSRLLHARDGLAIWGVRAIEAEALSNDAILLLLELPLTSSD